MTEDGREISRRRRRKKRWKGREDHSRRRVRERKIAVERSAVEAFRQQIRQSDYQLANRQGSRCVGCLVEA
jgi:hypothetical protein